MTSRQVVWSEYAAEFQRVFCRRTTKRLLPKQQRTLLDGVGVALRSDEPAYVTLRHILKKSI